MSPSQVDEALEAMRGLFPETPLQLNEHLSARYGANVYLKREDLTPVRSYKIRGAFNFFRKIVADSPSGTTFVCASAGNHAQGFAYVCRHFGVQGVVFIGDENRENERVIANIGAVRPLGRLPRLPEMTSEALHRAFARHFNLADFLEAPA